MFDAVYWSTAIDDVSDELVGFIIVLQLSKSHVNLSGEPHVTCMLVAQLSLRFFISSFVEIFA